MAGMVIVGAGECGARAAFALREAGYEGSVTLVGEEPHLPYERPPLSKNAPVSPRNISGEDRYSGEKITLLRGKCAKRIDHASKFVELSDGHEIAYEKLLIATGAKARLFSGIETARTLRTIDDARAILDRLGPNSRLGIVGGGFIGLELAATARKLGARVTVLEAADRLMARVVPAEIAAIAEARHRAEGVDIILGVAVREARPNRIALVDGATIDCDVVVAGVGAVPDTALAKSAGLDIDDGIVVDDSFRTSIEDIHAAGDCCCFPYRGKRIRLESWRAAQDQGNHAAAAMLGGRDVYDRVPWFWSDQYDLTLQIAGLPDASLSSVRRDIGGGAFLIFQLDAGGRLASASGIGSGNAVARDIRIAEMMIERGISVEPSRLADPELNLKSLLRG